jgi:hypothetical protein
MHNGIDPGRLSPAERLAELAEILATGLMRLRARQSTPYLRTAERVRSTVLPSRAVMPTVL